MFARPAFSMVSLVHLPSLVITRSNFRHCITKNSFTRIRILIFEKILKTNSILNRLLIYYYTVKPNYLINRARAR
jgi:hypothetical protein